MGDTNAAGPSRRSVYLPSDPQAPAPVLTHPQRVAEWPQSPGFQGFWGWVQHRCDSIKGKEIMAGERGGHQAGKDGDVVLKEDGIDTWMRLLDDMTKWVDEVPPAPQAAQRFGNLAFRKYIALVEAVSQFSCEAHIITDVSRGSLHTSLNLRYPLSCPDSSYLS
jgi:serine/threonine-protein phosphatase 2A activator